MIYYVLPGVGLFGGIKKAFQCIDMLSASGRDATAATPGGERPDWFEHRSSVIDRADLQARCTRVDTVLFSWPPDADFVASLPVARRIVHMQGANTPDDEELMARNREFHFISHGLHMSQRLMHHHVVAPLVPNSVSNVFRYNGEIRIPLSIACMPRKGGDVIDRLKAQLPSSICWRAIEGMKEEEAAAVLKTSDIFVSTSANEAFGLPPLEAMAAECCVVGYPGDGGFEFMRHGETAHLAINGDEQQLLRSLAFVLERPAYRDRLRNHAAEISARYTPERECAALLRALDLLSARTRGGPGR